MTDRDTHNPHPAPTPTAEPRTIGEALPRAYDVDYPPLTDADLQRPDIIDEIVDRWMPVHMAGLRYLEDH
jgi:hypothetical protein